MRWPRRREVTPRGSVDPVVLSVTTPLNRQTAIDLARRIERVEPSAPVVIDLTAIPAFDTEGAEELLHLQEAQHNRQVSIVGFRQATARLTGVATFEEPSAPPRLTGWVQRRLRNLVVVQPDDGVATAEGLEPALTAAGETDAAIVVVDLRGVAVVDAVAIDVIAFASGKAALRGQELLVVNVSNETAEALRAAGLSATTYVAPEPPAP